MESIHETKKTRRHWSKGLPQRAVLYGAQSHGTARHRAAIFPHHAVLIEFNSISAALDVQ
jgi:hypothetical protein